MDLLMVLLIVFLVLSSFLYIWYTRIIGRRNQALQALSGIDVQLKQRWEALLHK